MNIKEEAVKYLACRPRTCEEMRKHLLEKGYENEDALRTVNELLDIGYLNDIEYVVVYLNYGFSKGKGIKLIKYELYDKGVKNTDIEDGISAFEEQFGYSILEDEFERAKKQALKVIDNKDFLDEKLTIKIARRLSSKGFESNTIWSVINQLKTENEPVK